MPNIICLYKNFVEKENEEEKIKKNTVFMYKFVRPYKTPSTSKPKQTPKSPSNSANNTSQAAASSNQSEHASQEKEEKEENKPASITLSSPSSLLTEIISKPNIESTTTANPSQNNEQSTHVDRKLSFVQIKRNKSLDTKSDKISALNPTRDRNRPNSYCIIYDSNNIKGKKSFFYIF